MHEAKKKIHKAGRMKNSEQHYRRRKWSRFKAIIFCGS